MRVKSKTEDLESFLMVVDSGSFSAAAIGLNTQVAKISRAIARLEKELDTTLFNRSTRRIELTEAGQLFLKYVRESLDLLNRGEEALNSLQGMPKGKLRVDAASPFIFHQIVPHIAAFRAAYPDIQLELISGESFIDLIEKKTDVAIRIGRLQDSNLYARTLGISKLRLVASPRYLGIHAGPTSLAELKTHTLIGFADSPKLNNWHLGENELIKPHISASNGETIRQLVLEGNGIALLSNFMVEADLKQGKLVEVLPDSVQTPNPREAVNAVYYKNSAASARIEAFIEFFKGKFTL
ncbi:LysR family transcriptional regulator [Pseudoalteromonas xiamenensis]|uniref:LysR family transcriptional regulator n=1 Tax=Pseudoalteromonas xiamenensis TaxID=882626 RepID=A0A975HNM6_9GAMM|nr:LysR family transcriptional regulator [Pseudoalteromonas xiamenensis]QTH72370.1 LysR family transcriptional regulator [Pseudoalteromonas xiamenensis]